MDKACSMNVEKMNVYWLLVGKPEGNKTFKRAKTSVGG
jgi:hypothetical protein